MSERVVWTEAANENFITLKKRLCDKPVLCLPDLDRPFVLRSDASEIGFGAGMSGYRESVFQADHRALKYLGTAKYENNRIMRWALKLQAYRFLIQVILGKENVGGDFLSR